MGVESVRLTAVIARLDKRVWEIVGGGPQGWATRYQREGSGARAFRPFEGPFPEPWRPGGPSPDPWRPQVVALELTWRIADAAAAMAIRGEDAQAFVSRAVTSWCSNEVPGWPFPPEWAVPLPQRKMATEDAEDTASLVFAAATVSFAVLAEQVQDEALKTTLEEAASMTAERALAQTE
jgi:hypothetical protein